MAGAAGLSLGLDLLLAVCVNQLHQHPGIYCAQVCAVRGPVDWSHGGGTLQ